MFHTQTLTITVTLIHRYTILLPPHGCSQMTIVISSSMQKIEFQVVEFLPDILTLTLILSSTFLSSRTTVILNSSFKKIMAPNDPTQSMVFNFHLVS